MDKLRKPFENCPQFMTDEQLENEALYCLNYYSCKTGFDCLDAHKIKAEQICEYLLDEHGYIYISEKNIEIQKGSSYWAYTEGNDIVGYTDFSNKVVGIKKKILSDRFAMAHETKHAIGDGRFKPPYHGAKEHTKLETQANNFARFFLLPKTVFILRFMETYQLFSDSDVISYLMSDFMVSGRTILVRARELNLISEMTKQFLWHKKNYIKPNPLPLHIGASFLIS
jgi:hypothetical protein